MTRTYDVVVVGAGPAGSTCARLCAGAGLSVCMIEEHGAIGSPVQCAGLLSMAAFRECETSERCILNTVTGARIVSSLGAELVFDAGERKAHVVDRALLDREMADMAARAGAEIRLRTAFSGRDGARILTRGAKGRGEIPFRILIAADGARSGVARRMGMPRAPVYLSGLQADIVHEMNSCQVEIHPDASPEFFGWVIPLGPHRARIGLAGEREVKDRFSAFLRSVRSGSGGEGTGTCVHLVSGTIPLGLMPKTYGHQTLFVGDAAGMAKPTSGGGVYTGVRAARHAAAIAAKACNARDCSDRILQEYERAWKEDFGKELALGMKLFRMRSQLAPADLARVIGVMRDPEIVRAIVTQGDMDRPGRLARTILTNPKMLPLLSILIKSGVRRIYK